MLGIVGRDATSGAAYTGFPGAASTRGALPERWCSIVLPFCPDQRLTGVDERLCQQLRDEISRLRRRLGATIVGPTTGRIRVAHPNEQRYLGPVTVISTYCKL
jgi:hypothetical protein